MKNRDVGFWVLQGPGWLLLLYLIYAQAIPAINYDLGVALGLIDHGFRRYWGTIILSAALGITAYWPVVCLAAVVAARDASAWSLSNEKTYWIVLPLITIWGAWGLWYLLNQNRNSARHQVSRGITENIDPDQD